MADLTITIANSVNVFGGSFSTKWNSFTWGSGKWGEGTNSLVFDVEKSLSESISLSDAVTTTVDFTLSLSNSLAPTFEMSSEGLKTGDWSYVFPGNTTDAENRPNVSFTAGSNPTTSWTSGAVTSTSWSSI